MDLSETENRLRKVNHLNHEPGFLFFILLLFLIGFHFCGEVAQAQIGRVVKYFPAPGNSPTGIAWDGESLWIVDVSTNTIHQVDPETGDVLHAIPTPPGATVNGLTWDHINDQLWCSDRERGYFIRIDPVDGTPLQIFDIGSNYLRDSAFDGEDLFCVESVAREIIRIDADTGERIGSTPAPGNYNRGLAWDGIHFWSTDYENDEIYMLDAKTGRVIWIIPAPGTFPYGLAYDGEYLWNADYETDMIYKINLDRPMKYNINESLRAFIQFKVKIRNLGNVDMRLTTFLACPFENDYQMLDKPLVFQEPADDFMTDVYGQRIGFFSDVIPGGTEKDFGWTASTTLYDVRYFVLPEEVDPFGNAPQEIIDLYTKDGEKYKITDPAILAASQEAIGGETNPYWQVRNIHDYVIDRLEYINDHKWDDAATVLNQGHGSCTEYSYLFISLCRAAGIPARYEAGTHLKYDIPYEDRIFHRWQQVYFPGFGWIPLDCTWDDRELPCDQARYFCAASNRCFSTTQSGGGEYGLWWNYNIANLYTGGEFEYGDRVGEWLPYQTRVEVTFEETPTENTICHNYPNPFNTSTTIQFTLHAPSTVSLQIFDAAGRHAATLISEKRLTKGVHEITWDPGDLPSGIYHYRLNGSDGLASSGRMVLMK